MTLDRLARRYGTRPCVLAGYGEDHPLSLSIDHEAATVALDAEQRSVRRSKGDIQAVYVVGSM